MDFSETILVYDIKVDRPSHLNEYMYFMNIKVKDIHLPSSKVTQNQHFQTSFAQKPLGRLKPKFIWSLHGMWGMKICSNDPGHLTMPIYGEKLQISSSSEPRGKWPWNLVHSIGYSSTTNVFCMMTLGWPWLFLWHGQICFQMPFMGESLYSIEC